MHVIIYHRDLNQSTPGIDGSLSHTYIHPINSIIVHSSSCQLHCVQYRAVIAMCSQEREGANEECVPARSLKHFVESQFCMPA